MRFASEIESGDTFYTDLNAFQMIERRRRFDKLPLQAQFYPMAGMAHIEDTGVRLSLVSGQPLGASSLQAGRLEVMQDRRLSQDDNRGLNQVKLQKGNFCSNVWSQISPWHISITLTLRRPPFFPNSSLSSKDNLFCWEI